MSDNLDDLMRRCQLCLLEAQTLSAFTKQLVKASRLKIDLTCQATSVPLMPQAIAQTNRIKDLAALGTAAAILARLRDEPGLDSGASSVADLAVRVVLIVLEHHILEATACSLLVEDSAIAV